jgi:xylulokinase
MQPVEKFIRRPLPYINLVGGGGSSDIWCQIFSDVLNLEIRQAKDAVQANARGAAWIAAVGLGEISFSDVPRLIEFRHVYHPLPAHRTIYDERFEMFTQIYRQMRPVYHRLNP